MGSSNFWLFVLGVLAALTLQGLSLRVVHRRRLEALRSEHRVVLAELRGEFERATLGWRQWQRDQEEVALAALRMDVPSSRPAGPALSTREVLERQLDADPQAHPESTGDGFADTQIMAHEGQPAGLLLQ